MRLVTVTEDADDVRRRVRQSELESLGLDPGDVAEVLTRYGEARLLTFDRDPLTRGPTVEVAHEALLRHWERLRHWLDNRREAFILHRRFRAAHTEWAHSARGRQLPPHRGPAHPIRDLGLPPRGHPHPRRIPLPRPQRRRPRPSRNPPPPPPPRHPRRLRRRRHHRPRPRHHRPHPTATGHRIGPEAEEAAEQSEQAAAEAEQSAEVARARELAAEAENVLETDPGAQHPPRPRRPRAAPRGR